MDFIAQLCEVILGSYLEIWRLLSEQAGKSIMLVCMQ